MTVKQLIAKLNRLNPKLQVVVRGYEGGVDDVVRIDRVKLQLNAHQEWYYGRHEVKKDGDTPAYEIVGGDE